MTSRKSREDMRGEFVASALKARQQLARDGQAMAAADVHKWLLVRAAGAKPARPRAIKLVTRE